jgi:uncharacterized protein YuzE
MAKTVELAIDAPAVVSRVAEQYTLKLPRKIVMFHYDDSADTLYIHFQYPAKSVDSKIVDDHGEIILGLNEKRRIVNLTVVNASSYCLV